MALVVEDIAAVPSEEKTVASVAWLAEAGHSSFVAGLVVGGVAAVAASYETDSFAEHLEIV